MKRNALAVAINVAGLSLLGALCAPANTLRPDVVKSDVKEDPGTSQIVGRVTISGQTFAAVPGMPTLTPAQRGSMIKDRIQSLIEHNGKITQKDFQPKFMGGDWVVKVDKSLVKEGLVVTADPVYAKMRNTHPQELAKKLSVDLYRLLGNDHKQGYGGLPNARVLAPKPQAVQVYEEGMTAYDGGDFAAAETKFRNALKFEPKYRAAHFALCNTLIKAGKKGAAKIVLNNIHVTFGSKLDSMDKALYERMDKELK